MVYLNTIWDCTSLPPALQATNPYDAIVNITDNETWAGKTHAQQQLERLNGRRPVKYINIQMATNSYSVADTKNPNVLEVVGFDVSALPAIGAFIRGEL